MFRTISIFLVALALPVSLFSQKPELLVGTYVEHLKNEKYPEAAAMFADKSLSEFREAFDFLDSIENEQVKAQAVQAIFGKTPTAVDSLNDTQFFAAMMNFIFGKANQMGALNFENFKVVGSVSEGPNQTHVLARNRFDVGEMNLEQMEVLSFVKQDKDWKMQVSGRVQGLAAQLKAQMAMMNAQQSRQTQPPAAPQPQPPLKPAP